MLFHNISQNSNVFSLVDNMLAVREEGFVHVDKELISMPGLLSIRLHWQLKILNFLS